MNYITKTLYEDDWNFYLSNEKDNVIIDENSEAETDMETKEVWFRENDLKLSTVRHEIFHVFYSYTFTAAASLDSIQCEEVASELFAYQGKKIDKLADEVYLELLTLRDKKD